jgi:TRAP-type C4-dicarboxylate transport system permease small subunit
METAAKTFLGRLVRVESAVTTVAFGALILLVFADVASRELTGAGLHWARQTGVYANIVVVMLGLGLASDGGAHLRPRFADGWLPRSWLPVMLRLQHGLMALFCLAFAIVAIGVVRESFVLGVRSAALLIVIWPIQAIIPLTFLIAFVRHGLYALLPSLAPQEAAAADTDTASRRPAL